jgi:molybdopterin converting factor small subunit
MVKYTKAKEREVENGDYVKYFARIEKRFNKMKKEHEEELEKVFEEFTQQFKAEDYSH